MSRRLSAMLNERVVRMFCSKSHLIFIGQVEVIEREHDSGDLMGCLLKVACNRRHLR